MNFNDYQNQAAETAEYPNIDEAPGLYPALGLNGESGEVAEKIKKYWRDGGNFEETQSAIKKELGDVLWYLSETARQWGIPLENIAQTNLAKLASRRARNVIHGSGDNR